ncbi:hypothetical protein M9458_055417, partial [Cirrhinus mrigala]
YTSRGSAARDKRYQCESTMGACCSRPAYALLLRCLRSACAFSVKPVLGSEGALDNCKQWRF